MTRRVSIIALSLFAAVMLAEDLSVPHTVDVMQDWAAGRELLRGGDPYQPVGELVERHSGTEARVRPGQKGTPHPPASVLLLAPLSALSFVGMHYVWFLLSLAALFVAGWVFTSWHGYSGVWAFAPLALPFVHLDLAAGQISCVLLLLLVLGERSPGWVGLATALRIYPAILLARLHGRDLLTALLTATVVGGGAMLIVGIGPSLRWLTESAPTNIAIWIDFPANISLVGQLARVGLPVELGTLVCLVLAVAAARRVGYWESMPFILLASPIAWPQYAVLCLPAMIRHGSYGLLAAIGVSFAARTFVGWIGCLSLLVLAITTLRRSDQVEEEIPV